MDLLSSEIYVIIINEMNVKDMLMMRILSKELRNCVGEITHLSLEQTSSFITDLGRLQDKYNLLKKVMPKLKSMAISAFVSSDDILLPSIGYIFPKNPETGQVEFTGFDLLVKDCIISRLSWLSTERRREQSSLRDVDTKIDCQLSLVGNPCEERVITMMNYILFEVRGKFMVNKFKHLVRNVVTGKDELKTCFKIKEGIMTLSTQLTAIRGIYEVTHDQPGYPIERVARFNSLPWGDIKGIKVKDPMASYQGKCEYTFVKGTKRGLRCGVSTKGSNCCAACSKKVGKPAQMISINIEKARIRSLLKDIPFTCNKTSILRYV